MNIQVSFGDIDANPIGWLIHAFSRETTTLAEDSDLHDAESRFQAIVRVKQLKDVATQASARFLQPRPNRSTTLSQDTSSTEESRIQLLKLMGLRV